MHEIVVPEERGTGAEEFDLGFRMAVVEEDVCLSGYVAAKRGDALDVVLIGHGTVHRSGVIDDRLACFQWNRDLVFFVDEGNQVSERREL